jgi:hypothetical protein
MAISLTYTLLVVLAVACGSSSDSPRGNDASWCEREVDESIARLRECLEVTAEQRQTAIDQCTSGTLPPGTIDVDWRPEFNAEVEACSNTLTCKQLLEDFDDICFPQALAVLARGLLTEITISACIEGGSDECLAQLQAQPEPGANAVGTCFNRWAECSPQLVNSDPYWTEDHCGMILALTDASRSEAQSCVRLPCEEVAACLRDRGVLGF